MNFENIINTIQLGDCYELIKNVPDNSIDLVVIDPPYEYTTGGQGKNQTGQYKSLFDRKNKNKNELEKFTKMGLTRGQAHVWADKEKNRKEPQHLSSGFDFKVLDELDRVLKKINIYIWCSKHQVYPLLEHYLKKKCNIEIITWHKSNPLPTMNNTYANDTEYCIFARDKGVELYGTYKTKRKYYVTSINTCDKSKFLHPTIKPINIIENFIINSSKENDIVLDCFCGSGTTCVASKELRRKYIGIEINPEYYKIAIDRVNGITANGQTTIFTNYEYIEKQQSKGDK